MSIDRDKLWWKFWLKRKLRILATGQESIHAAFCLMKDSWDSKYTAFCKGELS